jgi:hypothetical protein
MEENRNTVSVGGAEAEHERTLSRLLEVLDVQEPLPPGLRSRLETAVDEAIRRDAVIGWEAITLISCIAFIIACISYPGVFSIGFTLTALATAAAYGLGLRWLARGPARPED